MSGWIITATILAVYTVGWYRNSLWLARRMNESVMRLDDDDKRFHLAMAMLTMLAWPVIRPLMALHARMLGHVPPTNEELRDQNAELRSEIARLEREAGIR